MVKNLGMTSPESFGKRWRATQASPHRDGNRWHQVQRRCCGACLASPHLPPSPLPLPHTARKGDGPSPFPSPLFAHRRGDWKGDVGWPVRKHVGTPSRNDCPGTVRAHEKSGFLIKLLERRRRSVGAQRWGATLLCPYIREASVGRSGGVQ